MQSHKNDTTYKMGIDIGSTTVKVVLADEENKIAFSRYRRHFSEIKKTVKDILKEAVALLWQRRLVWNSFRRWLRQQMP